MLNVLGVFKRWTLYKIKWVLVAENASYKENPKEMLEMKKRRTKMKKKCF